MVFALILCGLIAHVVVLGGSFKTMDDETSIVTQPEPAQFFSPLDAFFTESFFGGDRTYYRPLVTFSFLLDYQIAGLKAFFYYLTNLLLHLANAVLLFFIFNVLLKKKSLSFPAALLFVVHPVSWEAVANIAGRSILLCAFWQFAAFLLYLRYAARSRLDPRRKVYYVCALLAFALALLSKESAVVLPFFIAGHEYWTGRRHKGKVLTAQSVKRLLPFVAVVAGYLLLRKVLGDHQRRFLAVRTVPGFRRADVCKRRPGLPADIHFSRRPSFRPDHGVFYQFRGLGRVADAGGDRYF